MTTRRTFLKAATSAAVLAPTALGWDLAQAQSPTGTLRVGMTASAVPLSNGCPDQGAEGQRFMGITLYDQLIMWDLTKADKPSVLIPCLATAWKIDPANPKRWIFTIREGVKFHDGHVLTPADLIFSFDRAYKKDSPAYDARAAAQVGIRMPTIAAWGSDGPGNFWIETSIVDSTVPYGVVWVGITHQGAWEAAGKNWDTYLQKAVGTGPWKLETFSLRERAILARFDDHWDKSRITKSAKLILLPLPESNTRVAALRAGQVDFIEAPPPDAVDSLKGAGFKIVTNSYPHNWTWHFSRVEGSPWNDIRVRKAANLGIDRAGLKELLGGLMLEGAGLVPPGHQWHGNPSFKLTLDPDAARKLMTDAGYGPNKRLRTKIGISTSGSGQMQPQPMNEFLQQNLKDIYIDVDFEVYDWSSLIDVWHAGAKSPLGRGVTAINFSYGSFDPYNAFIRLLKSTLVAPGGVNWGYYSNPEMDAQFVRVYETFDQTQQDALLRTIHEKIVDDALFLFAAHDLNPRGLSPKVHGFVQAQNWSQDLTPISMG
jgi:ABC-type transport system substrate-binding protein